MKSHVLCSLFALMLQVRILTKDHRCLVILDIGAKDELEETMNVRLWEMINARIYNNMNNRTKE